MRSPIGSRRCRVNAKKGSKEKCYSSFALANFAQVLQISAPQPIQVSYRAALPEDAAECVALRGRTRENAVSEKRLRSLGVTSQSWGNDIRSGALPGHICSAAGKLVGYCFGARATGEIVVLALLPDFENRGIGRELLNRMIKELTELGHTRLFLGCSPDPLSRSYGFYRHLGWKSTGSFDQHGDEILELESIWPTVDSSLN